MDTKTNSPREATPGVAAAHPAEPVKKKKSSRGAKRLRDIESRVSKSAHRMTKAVNRGVETYLAARDRSDAKRKDGFAVDFVENVARGVSDTIAEGSPIIHDVAEAFNTRQLRKQIRSAAAMFGSIPLIGR